MLLIWAANQIKLYACYKKVGAPQVKPTVYKTDELSRIANKTKVILKNKKDEDEVMKKADAAKALKLRKEGISKLPPKDKTITLGHFVQTKKAVFSTEHEGIIEPELVKEDQKNKKLVDISVIRRGLNYHGANEKNLK